MKNFRAYQTAVELYKACENSKVKGHLRDQLLRASSSIVLNLAEGSAQQTKPNQRRFYAMAFGSLREIQAILDLTNLPQLTETADRLGGQLFCLLRSIR